MSRLGRALRGFPGSIGEAGVWLCIAVAEAILGMDGVAAVDGILAGVLAVSACRRRRPL